MIVDVALRDDESFEITYPDYIVCPETKRVWRRSTYPSQGKIRYDLVRSDWSPKAIKAKS